MDRVNQLAFILVALTLQKFYCVRKHTLIRANRLPISRGSNKTEAAALGLSILLCACFCSYRGHLIPSHSAHIYLVYCGIIFWVTLLLFWCPCLLPLFQVPRTSLLDNTSYKTLPQVPVTNRSTRNFWCEVHCLRAVSFTAVHSCEVKPLVISVK